MTLPATSAISANVAMRCWRQAGPPAGRNPPTHNKMRRYDDATLIDPCKPRARRAQLWQSGAENFLRLYRKILFRLSDEPGTVGTVPSDGPKFWLLRYCVHNLYCLIYLTCPRPHDPMLRRWRILNSGEGARQKVVRGAMIQDSGGPRHSHTV